ncbi:MAG TPA: hypothetical protein VK464_09310 [Symbiobacteriaceae bacterium]|nr:hypothetical protein [Symbiobacteriaceae bacterium]
MVRMLFYAAVVIVGLHGLVHLMGFVPYWPLAAVRELPYKTAIAGGHWLVGAGGMKLFGLLWLLAALGFVAAAVGLFAGQAWWRPVMLATVAVSTAVIALDWAPAFRGAVVNGVIVVVIAVASLHS